MRFLTIVCVFVFCSTATAQDFTTPKAKRAAEEYAADLEKVKKRYLISLTEAAKSAVETGNPDEADRIKAEQSRIETEIGDVIVWEGTQKIRNSRWSWISRINGENEGGVYFKADGGIELSGVKSGAWAMVGPKALLMWADKNIWIWEFNEKLDRYTINLYRPSEHNILPGKRLTP